MTEAELLALCRDREPAAGGLWSSRVYGIGKWLKRYAGYPDDLPLCAETDHGPGNATLPHKSFLESKAPAVLYHNAEAAKAFRHFSRKPCEVMGSPFVYFRWLNGLGIRPDAAGTVAFPSHSTHHVQARLDWRSYCSALRRIPDRYRPVKVCLYWKDILDGLHKVFREEGFEVITAGHIYDEGFVERFYGILAGHRFATSNEVCSAGIYAVEMGLPFLLWGEQEFTYFNAGGESKFPTGDFRPDDLVGYYVLDSESIGRLRAGGIPGSLAAALEGISGNRVRNASEFLDLLAKHADPRLAAPFRDAILKQAAVPLNPQRDRKPFLEPTERVSAAQAAYAEHFLGIHSALRPSQLRELLWACLDEAVLGKTGAVARIFPDLRRHAHDPASGRRPCHACGSFESKPEVLGGSPDPAAAGTFRLCLDCGSCSRFPTVPRPEPAPGLRREDVGGIIRIMGLESSLSPLDELKTLVRAGLERGTVHVLSPALGGEGPAAFLRDAGIRTLFTVTGMRCLLRRSGFTILSACQDSRGRIDAVARASGTGFPSIHASPEPVDRAIRTPAGTRADRSGEGGGEAGFPSVPAPVKAEASEVLAGLLSDLHSRPSSPGIYKALSELFFRLGNHAASEIWLGLYTEKAGPDESAYELMDRLRRQLGFERMPSDQVEAREAGPGWSAAPPDDADDSFGLIVRVIEALSQDRNAEALELIGAGLEAGRRDTELRYAQAIALERLERRPEAIEALEGLLAARPDHGEARAMLLRIDPDRRGR